MTAPDPVNHPAHYEAHPSGVECIEITEHMNFCLGNAVKYIWRADHKGNAVEDLRKAAWYIQREIERREKADAPFVEWLKQQHEKSDEPVQPAKSDLRAYCAAPSLMGYKCTRVVDHNGMHQATANGIVRARWTKL